MPLEVKLQKELTEVLHKEELLLTMITTYHLLMNDNVNIVSN